MSESKSSGELVSSKTAANAEAESAFVTFVTMVRSIVASAIVVPFTGFMCVVVILSGMLASTAVTTVFIRIWARVVMFLFCVRVVAHGAENLPSQGGGIMVFNHQSHLDIPAMILSTWRNIRFGAKVELFKIPFFGAAMKAVGTLPIARSNRAEVFRIYKEAEARFKENIIFVLAPEGTRQSEPSIGRFKSGPFVFAINAQVPVIPAVIKGAYHVMPKDRLSVNVGRWTRTIVIEYLAPVSTAGLTLDNVAELSERVRAQMVQAYEKI